MTPIILHDNRFADGAITATGVTDDTRLYIIDGRPYTWLVFPSSGTKYITVDCGTAKSADALGIIGHNFATSSATVSVESSADNNTWTQRLAGFTWASNRALLKTFTTASARYWRIKIVTASVAPAVAVVMLGSRITFPCSPDSSFTPFSESVEVDSNDSKNGQALGSVVRFFPVAIKPTFSNLTRTWVEGTYRPFRENWSRYRKYFFWAWDVDTYPTQVFYVQDVGQYAPAVSVLDYYDKLALDFKGVIEP